MTLSVSLLHQRADASIMLCTSDLECQRVKYFIKMIENISLLAYLVPESVEHDGVKTDNENQGQEVAENKETSLMDYRGVRIISLWFVVRVEQSRSGTERIYYG